MKIHEHQAKEILEKFGIKVPNGTVVFNLEDIDKKFAKLKTKKVALKAQIHAGGRGKAGGIKIVENINELKKEAKDLFGKKLVTHQTGKDGRIVKRLYYLSCLVDRSSSKIAFLSSAEGGVDIERVAKNNPKKITTVKLNLSNRINNSDVKKILEPFALPAELEKESHDLIQLIYKVLVEKDASLIEINPLVLTKTNELICLDAKINFDDNALYRHPDIASLKDLNEEDPIETKASQNDLSYIKLGGKIGCMVNGAGLAMATMDMIQHAGGEPANFLDIGGGASAQRVATSIELVLSDENVEAILVNIFAGINRCDWVAQGIVDLLNKRDIDVPLVVRLSGTNVEKGQKILRDSGKKVITAETLSDAAHTVVAEWKKSTGK